MNPLLRSVGYVLLAVGVALLALQAAQLAHEGVLPHRALGVLPHRALSAPTRIERVV